MVELSETIFNAVYLLILIILTTYMLLNVKNVIADKKQTAKHFAHAFLALCAGDLVHLISRIIAMATGGIERHYPLVGHGAFFTAITFTIFFVFLTQIWRTELNSDRLFIWWLLMMLAIVRVLILMLPYNNWFEADSSRLWSLIRNGMLLLQGISVGILFIVSSSKSQKLFRSIGIFIVTSFIVYMPAYLLVGVPNKSYALPITISFILHTICYVILAFLARKWFKQHLIKT